jgi:hypothetical protein
VAAERVTKFFIEIRVLQYINRRGAPLADDGYGTEAGNGRPVTWVVGILRRGGQGAAHVFTSG